MRVLSPSLVDNHKKRHHTPKKYLYVTYCCSHKSLFGTCLWMQDSLLPGDILWMLRKQAGSMLTSKDVSILVCQVCVWRVRLHSEAELGLLLRCPGISGLALVGSSKSLPSREGILVSSMTGAGSGGRGKESWAREVRECAWPLHVVWRPGFSEASGGTKHGHHLDFNSVKPSLEFCPPECYANTFVLSETTKRVLIC